MDFDISRAWIGKPDWFPRFRVPDRGEPLETFDLSPRTWLLVAERGGEKRAFRMDQMAFHHLAQGRLGGEPYAVSFCVVCQAGVGLTPKVDDLHLHLSVGAVYDGMSMLVDDETGTLWHQITGEAVHGPLAGERLETWPIRITTVEAALLEDPDLSLSRSRPKLFSFERLIAAVWSLGFQRKTIFPWGFRRTMGAVDDRRPEMEIGLGVVTDDGARFYPTRQLPSRPVRHELGGREIEVGVDPDDQIPVARWADDGERPFQMLTRWYGFSLTFPGCEIFEASPDMVGEVALEEDDLAALVPSVSPD